MSATPDQQDSQRLVLSRRQMSCIVGRRYGAVCLGFALLAALGGAIGLTGRSTEARIFGAALIVAFLVFCVVMYVQGRKEVNKEFPQLPVIEATPEELRLVEPSGETFRVQRDGLVSVVRLTAPGIRGSRVLFRDAAGQTITHWNLYWIAPVAMRWISRLGYPTWRITGQAAAKAAYPEDDIDGQSSESQGG